jgi:hypothetical protein
VRSARPLRTCGSPCEYLSVHITTPYIDASYRLFDEAKSSRRSIRFERDTAAHCSWPASSQLADFEQITHATVSLQLPSRFLGREKVRIVPNQPDLAKRSMGHHSQHCPRIVSALKVWLKITWHEHIIYIITPAMKISKSLLRLVLLRVHRLEDGFPEISSAPLGPFWLTSEPTDDHVSAAHVRLLSPPAPPDVPVPLFRALGGGGVCRRAAPSGPHARSGSGGGDRSVLLLSTSEAPQAHHAASEARPPVGRTPRRTLEPVAHPPGVCAPAARAQELCCWTAPTGC